MPMNKIQGMFAQYFDTLQRWQQMKAQEEQGLWSREQQGQQRKQWGQAEEARKANQDIMGSIAEATQPQTTVTQSPTPIFSRGASQFSLLPGMEQPGQRPINFNPAQTQTRTPTMSEAQFSVFRANPQRWAQAGLGLPQEEKREISAYNPESDLFKDGELFRKGIPKPETSPNLIARNEYDEKRVLRTRFYDPKTGKPVSWGGEVVQPSAKSAKSPSADPEYKRAIAKQTAAIKAVEDARNALEKVLENEVPNAKKSNPKIPALQAKLETAIKDSSEAVKYADDVYARLTQGSLDVEGFDWDAPAPEGTGYATMQEYYEATLAEHPGEVDSEENQQAFIELLNQANAK